MEQHWAKFNRTNGYKTLQRMDMSHSSKIVWKLNRDLKESKAYCNVTRKQTAHQLILNGKPDTSYKRRVSTTSHKPRKSTMTHLSQQSSEAY